MREIVTPDPAGPRAEQTDKIIEAAPAQPATDSPASTTPGRMSLLVKRMSSGWELKEKVARPVIVNLLTAAIIGIWVWFFSADIRRWFFPPPRPADWPIYCVLEPVVNASPEAQLEADLYVVNLEATKHDTNTLRDRAEAAQTDPSLRPPIAITVQITGSSHRLLGIDPDMSFNEGKGRLRASNEGKVQRWTVTVEQIERQAILRARIKTDARRPITSKADLETMPLKLLYARTFP